MSFEWPWQHSFPPFFTLQPNADTRRKQLSAWCSLVLSYCRHHRLYTLDLLEMAEEGAACRAGAPGATDPMGPAGATGPLFSNKKIQRRLPAEAVRLVLEELCRQGHAEWLDGDGDKQRKQQQQRCLVMWRRPAEWASLLHRWVVGGGLADGVFTLYELAHGQQTAGQEFHGLEERTLLRALQALQAQGKAELIAAADGGGATGVKFFL